jgi:hypothetical protein
MMNVLAAISWAPALAIAGGVLALGPIIIHIIFRWRYRLIDFAAMRFIFDSLKRNRQRLRIEEIIIIALRVLACLLIGLLLANIRAESLFPTGLSTPTLHVFVLDDSMSMGQQLRGATTIFQKAATHIAEAIQKINDNDMIAVVSACQPESGKPLGAASLARNLKGDFGRRLTAMKPTDLRARFGDAMSRVRELTDEHKDLIAKVYVVSDFRAAEFVQPDSVDALRKAVATAIGPQVELMLLDFGLPAPSNLTVERLELLDNLAVASVGAQFQVTLRNNGSEAVEGAAVTPQFAGATLPVIPLPPMAPGETVKKTFRYVYPSPGVQWARVSVPADDLPADGQAALALPVLSAMRILIVDGSPNPSAPTSGSFCLAHALDPSGQGAFGQRVEVIGPEALGDRDLEDYDVVFLTNVRELAVGRDEAGRPVWPHLVSLERYVRGGGGLGVFVGDQVNLDFYNGPLFAGGAGLAPLRISGHSIPQPDLKDPVRLRPDSIAPEPMLRIYTGAAEKFARMVRYYAYLKADEGPIAASQGSGPAAVLARFDDERRSPALARRALGRGNVLMWYTASDTKWSNWPRDFSYLPVVNDMAWALARRTSEGHDGRVLQPLAWPLPNHLLDATGIVLKTPAYPAEDLQVLRPRGEGKRKILDYPSPPHSGLYEVEFTLPRGKQVVYFSRGIDPAEGNLAKASAADIAKVVGPNHVYHGDLSRTALVAAKSTDRAAYWKLLLGGLLVVLAIETFLAQRFGHYART